MQEQLRNLVREQSPASPSAVGYVCGIDKSAICRFMQGGSLSSQNIEKLIDGLGIIVTMKATMQVTPIRQGRPKQNK